MLRLRLGPESALEIPEEGPAARARTRADRALRARRPAPSSRSPSSSPRAARSAPRSSPRSSRSAREPMLAVEVFEEGAEPEVWARARGPGQPLRGRDGARRHGARKGDVQQPRPARERARDRRAPPRRARRGRRSVAEPSAGASSAASRRASRATRRGAASWPASGGALMAATAGGVVSKAVKPGEADAYHFCGHTFTTGSCPHPQRAAADRRPRLPAAARTASRSTTSAGRSTTRASRSTATASVKRDPDGRPLPPAPRTKVCDEVGERSSASTPRSTAAGTGAAAGTVRKLVDCCSYRNRRINGDAALEGYCFSGRKVFCVMYFQTKVPC